MLKLSGFCNPGRHLFHMRTKTKPWPAVQVVGLHDSCFLFLILAIFFLPKNWDHNSYSSNKNVFIALSKNSICYKSKYIFNWHFMLDFVSFYVVLLYSGVVMLPCGAATTLKHDHQAPLSGMCIFFGTSKPSAPGFFISLRLKTFCFSLLGWLIRV